MDLIRFSLSDPALEKQLARDLFFRRFVGLSLSERIPDHSTFWRFRNLLEELQLNEVLLEEINLQLGDKGLLISVAIIAAKELQKKADITSEETATLKSELGTLKSETAGLISENDRLQKRLASLEKLVTNLASASILKGKGYKVAIK